MEFIFKDGTSAKRDPRGTSQIATGQIFVGPEIPPKGVPRVWQKPSTYARLINVRNELIQPGAYMMMSDGLKLVLQIKR